MKKKNLNQLYELSTFERLLVVLEMLELSQRSLQKVAYLQNKDSKIGSELLKSVEETLGIVKTTLHVYRAGRH